MFSNQKASPVMILVPVILFIIAMVLATLIVVNLNSNTNSSQTNTTANSTQTTTQTNNTNTTNNTNATNTTNSTTNTQTQNKVKDINSIVSSAPVGEYTQGECPQYLVLESNGNSFAIKNDLKYSLSTSVKNWVTANCSEVETLNY